MRIFFIRTTKINDDRYKFLSNYAQDKTINGIYPYFRVRFTENSNDTTSDNCA